MRTRLLTAVAVVASALIVPSAAFADPVLTAPLAPIVTNTAPVNITWDEAGAEDQFRVVSDAPVSGNCLSSPSIPTAVSGILPTTPTSYALTPSANGALCYYVEGQNGLAITYSAPALITWDTQAPTATLGGVTASTSVRGTLNLTSAPTDGGSGVDTVTFWQRSLPGGTFQQIGPTVHTPDPYAASFDTTGVGDGNYEFQAIATDAAGNPDSATVTNVLVDNTQPVATLGGVTASTSVRGTLNLTSAPTDGGSGVDTVTFWQRSLPGGTFQQIGPAVHAPGPYAASFDSTGVSSGNYEFQAIATDAVGNPKSVTVTNVLVDNTLPTVTLGGVTASTSVKGTLNLTSTPTDGGSGVDTVTFWQRSLPSGSFQQVGSTMHAPGPYAASFDTTSVADGSYEFQAIATDAVGNPKSVTVTNVLVDNTLPTVTLGGVVASTNVRGTLNLTSAPADGGSGVDTVTFWRRVLPSGSFLQIGSTVHTPGPYAASFDTTGVADGNYEFRAIASDVAGNSATILVTSVRIDNTLPSTPATPTGLTSVSASPTITFVPVSDPGTFASGIGHYDIFRNGGGTPINVTPIPAGGPFTWSDVAGQSTTPASGTNTYAYSVAAVDLAGNVSTHSTALSIFMDATAASAPTSLSALASPTTQRPQVSWGPPSWSTPAFTIEHYKVYRNGVFVGDVVGTSFTDNQPTLPDNTYSYQVVAASLGDATLGIASATVAVIYDTTAPVAPAGVVASPAIDGSIGISWSAATDGTGSGIARYVVRRSLSSTAPASVSDGDATCQGPATSCIDPTALNGKLYTYAVFAVDRAGNTSLAGVAAAVTARDQLAPAEPEGLSATPSDASVALQWAAAGTDDDVAGYVLVAKQGTQAPSTETDGTRVCLAIAAASTNCVATGLTNGATYTFGLFALDEALNRSQPAVVSAAPNGKVTDAKAPAAVSKLTAKVSEHKVTLTWKNPADHDFDHVEITAGQRKPDALKAAKRVYSGKGSKATTTLAAGQSRWFIVVAYDAVGNASTPASVHVMIPAASKFGPAPRAKVHGKVRLSWPVAKGAKYYNVQVFAGKKRILVSWPAGRALRLPRAKLKRGTKYTWYVWPGLGVKAKAHYGKLIGKNAFTFTG